MPDGHFSSESEILTSIAPFYLADESNVLRELAATLDLSAADRKHIGAQARSLVQSLRRKANGLDLMDAFLQEYGLSAEEGVTLMRLSEALIRTPDFTTSRMLVRDKISAGAWGRHAGASMQPLVNVATEGLRVSSAWIRSTGGVHAANLLAKLGDRVMSAAVGQAMFLMGEHFVLGRSIEAAAKKAQKSQANGFTHSYDMLGEAAHTAEDAERYFNAYAHAIRHLAEKSGGAASIAEAPGISVKLSALHPLYEYAQRETCIPALVARIVELAKVARNANLGFTIDAEEAERLELSLLIFDTLLRDPSLENWDGLGIVVQAYQRRAVPALKWILNAARNNHRKIAVRLVKGAYWDFEIKRAQELGLNSYPVFTRKENTDVSYLACARILLEATDVGYPQFATHNAHTAAAILSMAREKQDFEFQRLHGMGETLHAELMSQYGARSRIYAPVGDHKDLLPYLVRRLLENGANSSFVNQLLDLNVDIDEIARDPVSIALGNELAENPKISTPRDLFNGERLSALGVDLTQSFEGDRFQSAAQTPPFLTARPIINGEERSGDNNVKIENPATPGATVGSAQMATEADIDDAVAAALASSWPSAVTARERAEILFAAAEFLEDDMAGLIALCVKEAGKTLPDGVAEVREAVDFCRYYALQALSPDMQKRKPLGPVACISPWNFPLAIFIGQVTAALAAGDTVIAKPAEQTPLIAYQAVKFLYRAGVPKDALHLLIGGGDIGGRLTRHKDIAGICFTGSTETAKRIAENLADVGNPDTPFIAETGGLNTMIIDSTALLEQAVQDVVDSAFQSAGQRCSACRFVIVQEDIADDFIRMLSGSMNALNVGDPADLSTDLGPVIDTDAYRTISEYIATMEKRFPVVGRTPVSNSYAACPFIAPIAFEVGSIADVEREIFGPVLHVVRFPADRLDGILDDINGLGYGLTMGLHTRIDARVDQVAKRAKVGNLYVNRNQIGAVVGVQPFGGEGLSGTGPKAGGPHYLLRLSQPANASIPPDAAPLQPQSNDTPSSCEKIPAAIARARSALSGWAPQDRRKALDEATAHFPESADIHGIIENAARLEAFPIELPGPTGEKNTLRLSPRGVLLVCCASDVSIALTQVTTALAAGNAAIAIANKDTRQKLDEFRRDLIAAGAPSNILTIYPLNMTSRIFASAVDGVLAENPDRTYFATRICRRPGAILPLLSVTDPLQRFFHERTLTINTTAAGGNASLLAMTP